MRGRVEEIGPCAFAGCKGLISVTIPQSVCSIAVTAFQQYNALGGARPLSKSEVVFKVTPGSYGEQFCKTNGLKHIHP